MHSSSAARDPRTLTSIADRRSPLASHRTILPIGSRILPSFKPVFNFIYGWVSHDDFCRLKLHESRAAVFFGRPGKAVPYRVVLVELCEVLTLRLDESRYPLSEQCGLLIFVKLPPQSLESSNIPQQSLHGKTDITRRSKLIFEEFPLTSVFPRAMSLRGNSAPLQLHGPSFASSTAVSKTSR